MARSTLAMVSTSVIRGTLDSTLRPSAKRQATISLSTEFLAPPAHTVPDSGPLGSTMIWSIDLKYRRSRAPRPGDRRSPAHYGQ